MLRPTATTCCASSMPRAPSSARRARNTPPEHPDVRNLERTVAALEAELGKPRAVARPRLSRDA